MTTPLGQEPVGSPQRGQPSENKKGWEKGKLRPGRDGIEKKLKSDVIGGAYREQATGKPSQIQAETTSNKLPENETHIKEKRTIEQLADKAKKSFSGLQQKLIDLKNYYMSLRPRLTTPEEKKVIREEMNEFLQGLIDSYRQIPNALKSDAQDLILKTRKIIKEIERELKATSEFLKSSIQDPVKEQFTKFNAKATKVLNELKKELSRREVDLPRHDDEVRDEDEDIEKTPE